jgi:phage tail sheath protein FI
MREAVAAFVGRVAMGQAAGLQAVSSIAEFEQTFGVAGDEAFPLANAAKGFFANGGMRLWVAPVTDAEWAPALISLEEVEEVVLVAAPGEPDAAGALIDHTEKMRYRFAVIDAGPDESAEGISAFREKTDTSRAALYFPWLMDGSVRVPPSGAVTGILARVDREKGVWKSPGDEVVRGVTGLAGEASAGAVSAIRMFPGQGVRLWLARTLSKDPEWRYISVRRLMSEIEYSLQTATIWAVFEPNDEALWAKVRATCEEYLNGLWRQGALMGT